MEDLLSTGPTQSSFSSISDILTKLGKYAFQSLNKKSLDSMHKLLYVHCAVYSAVFSAQCTEYTVHYTVHSALCALYTIQCTVLYVHCALYSAHSCNYSVTVQCTPLKMVRYSVLCTLFTVVCTLYTDHSLYSLHSLYCF